MTNPEISIIMGSDSDLPTMQGAIAAGVDGFCLKDSTIEKLADAVRITHKKGRYEDPAIVSLSRI